MSEVTRAEFEKMDRRIDQMLTRFGQLLDLVERIQTRTMDDSKRLSRVERLADGVKDGLLCLSFRAKVAGSISNATHTEVCDHVSAAQQPAPTADGAGVEVKP